MRPQLRSTRQDRKACDAIRKGIQTPKKHKYAGVCLACIDAAAAKVSSRASEVLARSQVRSVCTTRHVKAVSKQTDTTPQMRVHPEQHVPRQTRCCGAPPWQQPSARIQRCCSDPVAPERRGRNDLPIDRNG